MHESEARFTSAVNHAFPDVNYALRMETVADRVKALRNELGVTQEGLGKLAGVSKSAVSQWERGLTEPEWEALRELQRAKNVNPSWVSHGDGEMFGGPKRLGGEAEDAGDAGQVLQIIRRMEGKVTPRSRRTLLRLEKIAIEGKMTDEDWELVEQIVERFEGRQGD